jgi:septum formation protein
MYKKVVLASASPRRRELLKMVVPDFEIATGIDVDETYPNDTPTDDVPVYLSKIKAEAYRSRLSPTDVLITADTVVIVDDKILGKPANRDEAVAMLALLSGREHKVITGVSITTCDKMESFGCSTLVKFDHLSKADIEYYVDNYKPFDKAGAYGIQEWIGAAGISGINGSFYNVMGLPVHALFLKLRHYIAL